MGNAAPLMCHEAAATAAARRQGEKVAAPPAGQQEGGGAATLVTVKVVMTRKEAERLIARLHEQGARERKARMAELEGQLRAGGGGVRAPPRRLAPIQED